MNLCEISPWRASAGRISACIVCRSEADKLAACLESVRWADEILVMDLSSEDGSAALAVVIPRMNWDLGYPPSHPVQRYEPQPMAIATIVLYCYKSVGLNPFDCGRSNGPLGRGH